MGGSAGWRMAIVMVVMMMMMIVIVMITVIAMVAEVAILAREPTPHIRSAVHFPSRKASIFAQKLSPQTNKPACL